MGFLADLLFGKEQKPEYLGSPETLAYVRQIQGTTPASVYSEDVTGALRGAAGIYGKTPNAFRAMDAVNQPLANATNQYLSRMLNQNQNVMDTEGFQQYRQSMMSQLGQGLTAAAGQAGASGMLRGSGAERLTGRVTSDIMNQLGQQAFAAQQAGLQRQFGAAGLASQRELGLRGQAFSEYMGQQGLGLQRAAGMAGLGQLYAGLNQQDIANLYNQQALGLQGAGLFNSSFGVICFQSYLAKKRN